MEFRENPAIYIQIAEYVCEQILLKKWKPGDKIISIRELSIAIEISPNTVQRAYDFLQQKNIITNKRGIGYFTEPDAENVSCYSGANNSCKMNYLYFLRSLYLLKIDIKEISVRYQQFIKDNFQNK